MSSDVWQEGRRRAVADILRRARAAHLTHVFFPGWTIAYPRGKVAPATVARDVRWLAREAGDLAVIAEFAEIAPGGKGAGKTDGEFRGPAGPFGVIAVEGGRRINQEPIQQRFATAHHVRTPCPEYVEVLSAVLQGGRTISLAGLRILVLVCGESSLVRNVQSRRNKPVLRHSIDGHRLRDIQDLEYDVLFNPGHTVVGNRGKMFRRWAALSERPSSSGRPRTTIHTANVARDQASGLATRVFVNGQPEPVPTKVVDALQGCWILRELGFPP